ncbi:MAG: hypothetical protein HQK75_02370 [Candidatus Magnetomorum sp.]|nr:hypothetical protein [Candidatus Magnetomorum sp.]
MIQNYFPDVHESQSNPLTTNLILLMCLWVPLNIIIALYPFINDTPLIFFDVWIFFIFGYWIAYQVFFRSNDQMMIIRTYFNYFVVLIPCTLMFQCLPIPAHAIKLLSPKTWLDAQLITIQAPWIFKISHGWGNLTYFSDKTLLLSNHGIACVMLFLLLVHTIKTRVQLSIILYSLLGALIAGTIAACLFFYDWEQKKSFSSMNHHIAIMIHIMIPMCLGLLMTYYRQSKKPVFKTFFYSIKMTFNHLVSGQHANLMKVALMMMIFFGFVLLSNSFGLKLLSLGISIFLGGVLFINKKKMRSQVFVWCILGLGTGIYALVSNHSLTNFSFNSLISSVAKDYPLTGIGFGALPIVISKYADLDCNSQTFHGNLYSGWLKLLAEMGLISMGICLSSLFLFIFRMYGMWIKRQNSYSNGWALGILTALVGVGLFGIGYGFGNPYIVLPVITAVAACGFLVLHAGHHSSRRPFFYRTLSIQRKHWQTRFISALLLIFVIVGMGQLIFYTKISNYEPVDTYSETERIQQIKRNMFNPYLWHDMAKWYRTQDKDPVNHMKLYLPHADVCYEIASFLAPKNTQIVLDTALYWVWRSQMLETLSTTSLSETQQRIPKTQDQGIRYFQNKFQTVLNQNPDKIKFIVDAIWEWYESDTIVLDAIPEKSKKLRQVALEYVLLHKQ